MTEIKLKSRDGVVKTAALVDDDDAPALLLRTWHLSKEGYAVCNIRQGKWKTLRLHRLVMNAPAGIEVDHISGDRLDCRRQNLRLVTLQENAHNRAKRRSARTSTYRGVWWDGRMKRWRAKVVVGGVPVFTGTFLDEQSAAVAAAQARQRFMTHTVESRHPVEVVS